MSIPRAPKLPSDLALLESADPVELSLVYFAARAGRVDVEILKARAAAEPQTLAEAL